MSHLQGKVAIVTGAGSGIGKATAMRLAEHGAEVIVSDIDTDAGESVVGGIESAGGTAMFVKADVSSPEDVEALVRKTVDEYGRLDLAVNNAGIGGPAATSADYSEEDWRKVMSINLDGVWRCLKHEVNAMKDSGGGSIVNVASILGLVGWAQAPAYVAAKHGVVGLTKAAALEFAEDGIRVNCVNPGFIETPLLEGAGITPGSDMYAFIAGKHAMNRLGKPDEVAAIITWLLSDEASFVTGSPYPVDGGYTAQ